MMTLCSEIFMVHTTEKKKNQRQTNEQKATCIQDINQKNLHVH